MSPSDSVFSQARLHIHWTLSGRYHSAVLSSLHLNLRGSSGTSGRQFRFGRRADRSLTLVLIHTLLEECGLKKKKKERRRGCLRMHNSKSGLFCRLCFDSMLIFCSPNIGDNSSVLPVRTEGAETCWSQPTRARSNVADVALESYV